MDPITDRGPAPSFYDVPARMEREAVDCVMCGGQKKIGCTPECEQPEILDYCPKCGGGPNCYHLESYRRLYDKWQSDERFCIKHHVCPRCHGSGDDPVK